MARIRTVKPEFFRHFGLYQAEKAESLPLRLCFVGLWTVADRRGRFKWIPEQLKVDCCPYDDIDFSRVLDALATRGFLVKYASNEEFFGWIPSFETHQVINNRESESILPDPATCGILSDTSTRAPRVPHACLTESQGYKAEGKGKEGNKEGKGTDISSERLPSQSSSPAFSLPLNTGAEFGISEEQITEWQRLFPKVDVEQQLRSMHAWCVANPKKRKTAKGIMRFAVNWLSSQQDRGPANGSRQKPTGADLHAQNEATLRRMLERDHEAG